jgi:restriction system protein
MASQHGWVLRIAPRGLDRVPHALRDDDLIIGWSGALGLLDPTLDWARFRQIIRDVYYSEDEDQQRSGCAAGNMWRFVREMQVSDLVVVPWGDSFYVAEVAGPARHEPDKIDEDTAHRRKVSWLNGKRPVPRRIARTALQSRMTVRGTCADATDLLGEIRDAVEQAQRGANPTFATDLQALLVEHTLAELRRGRINDHGFELVVRDLMKGLGAKDARIIARSQDKGADVVATFPVAGAFEFTVAVQAKHYQAVPPVQPHVIDELVGGMEAESANLGMVVTAGTFAPETEMYAARLREEQGRNIELVDGQQLAALLVRIGVGGV